jgi:uncharacterized protein YijF (DUF1287 family)
MKARLGALAVVLAFASAHAAPNARAIWIDTFLSSYKPDIRARGLAAAQCASVLQAARAQVSDSISYDPGYFRIRYPSGDVPSGKGVCADVIIRSFRAASIDLQQLVGEDMSAHFASYPRLWGLRQPDHNIDHRRVPNLMAWFQRNGTTLPISPRGSDYAPCDVVAWDLGGGVTHIGVVSDRTTGGRPLIVHHIGGHPTEEDVLFSWRIIGHFAF